jgi:hypothetical protein
MTAVSVRLFRDACVVRSGRISFVERISARIDFVLRRQDIDSLVAANPAAKVIGIKFIQPLRENQNSQTVVI